LQRTKTPSYVLEFPLKVNKTQARALEVRFEAGRNLYNAVLGECLKRARKLKTLPEYQEALNLLNSGSRKKAQKLFRQAREKADFNYPSIQRWGIRCKNACWIGDHLDTHTAQKVIERAFHAVNEWLLGKRGRPRFKPKRRFRSLESKTNLSGIRLRGSYEKLDLKVEWAGLVLPLRLKTSRAFKDEKARFAFENHPIKYCRIVKRTIGLRERYFVQVVFEGHPWRRWSEPRGDAVGLDFGPSFVVYASRIASGFFSPGQHLKDLSREKRRLQRKLDRQRRANNPENYNPDGTVKKGTKRWKKSRGMILTERRLAEIDRKLKGTRRTVLGRFANFLVDTFALIRFEHNSFRSFQRNFGRSVNRNGLGALVQLLSYKAESAGRRVEAVSEHLALSQKCLCGERVEKRLSDRVHICPSCGLVFQRDLLSAYLVASGGRVQPWDEEWERSLMSGWLQGLKVAPRYIVGPDVLRLRSREGTGAGPVAASGHCDNLRGTAVSAVRPEGSDESLDLRDRAGPPETGEPRPELHVRERFAAGSGLNPVRRTPWL